MKVSVCMAVYNGERFIEEQVASILPQLAVDDELIISDNFSTDATLDRIRRFHDERIKTVRNQEFTSFIFNFENALKIAKGDVIFLTDCDDIWMPNKVAVMTDLLKSFDLVVSDSEVIDAEGNTLFASYFELRGSGRGVLRNLISNTYVGSCMAFRREILKIALPFPKRIPMHDIWIASLAELFGSTHFCRERLIKYRRHGANLSPTSEKSPYSLVQKIGFRINVIVPLATRFLKYRLLGSVTRSVSDKM